MLQKQVTEKRTPSANRFPILSLDSQSLEPAMGYCFETDWIHRHESLLSLLWKFVAVNGAPAQIVLRYLDPQADPYWGIAPIRAPKLVNSGARLLRVSRNVIARALLTENAYAVANTSFRFCEVCATRGFHSVLFQLPSVTHCPVHTNSALVDRCRNCKKSLRYELNILTLEHPYRCSHCNKYFNKRLVEQLQLLRQPKGRRVPAFENAYAKFGAPLLGYPGTRKLSPFQPQFVSRDVLKALREGQHTLNDEEWNRLALLANRRSRNFNSDNEITR